MDNSKLKALILDADPEIHQTYRSTLASDFILLQAQTIGEAERFFHAHCNDLQLIIVSESLIQNIPMGLMLVHIARKAKSNAFIIGVSLNQRCNDQLFEAGCDSCFPQQDGVIRFIRAMMVGYPAGSNPFERDALPTADRSNLSGTERARRFWEAREADESNDPSRSSK